MLYGTVTEFLRAHAIWVIGLDLAAAVVTVWWAGWSSARRLEDELWAMRRLPKNPEGDWSWPR